MRIARLVVASVLASAACVPLPGNRSLPRRTVVSKQAENILVSTDGASCRVTASAFDRAQIADDHTCAWKRWRRTARAAPCSTGAQNGRASQVVRDRESAMASAAHTDAGVWKDRSPRFGSGFPAYSAFHAPVVVTATRMRTPVLLALGFVVVVADAPELRAQGAPTAPEASDSAAFAAVLRTVPGAPDVRLHVDPRPLRADAAVMVVAPASYAPGESAAARAALAARRSLLRERGVAEIDALASAGCAGIMAPPTAARDACPREIQRIVLASTPRADASAGTVWMRVLVVDAGRSGSTLVAWDVALARPAAGAPGAWRVTRWTPLAVIE